MIFGSDDYIVEISNQDDLKSIAEIYNSNKEFLSAHISHDYIADQWVKDEIEEMKRAGFISSKIVNKKSDKVIGIIDYKLADESYLSLLMLHSNVKKCGTGSRIYRLFESYLKSNGAQSVRIDVVSNYDPNVRSFWGKQGFVIADKAVLKWDGKELPAFVMKKDFIQNL